MSVALSFTAKKYQKKTGQMNIVDCFEVIYATVRMVEFYLLNSKALTSLLVKLSPQSTAVTDITAVADPLKESLCFRH